MTLCIIKNMASRIWGDARVPMKEGAKFLYYVAVLLGIVWSVENTWWGPWVFGTLFGGPILAGILYGLYCLGCYFRDVFLEARERCR